MWKHGQTCCRHVAEIAAAVPEVEVGGVRCQIHCLVELQQACERSSQRWVCLVSSFRGDRDQSLPLPKWTYGSVLPEHDWDHYCRLRIEALCDDVDGSLSVSAAALV